MKPKSLGWKFAILALMIATFGYVLFAENLKLGIDLRGGHSLIFQINTEGAADQNLSAQLIDIMKERVDPQGVRNLEWRPAGSDRFEVRMPEGSPMARQLKQAYMESLESLERRNLKPGDIRAIVSAEGEGREALISQRVGAGSDRAALLSQAAELYQIISTTESGTAAHENAKADYASVLDQIRGSNISSRELGAVFDLYLPPRQARNMAARDVEARRNQLQDSMAALRERYPAASEQIAQTFEAYKAWADVRGELDDPQDLIRLIRRAGVLEFRVAPTFGGKALNIDQATAERYLRQLSTEGPTLGRQRNEPFQWFKIHGEDRFPGMIVGEWGGEKYLLLSDEPAHTMLRRKDAPSWALEANATNDEAGAPAVGFTMNDEGANLMAMLTRSHMQEPMAVLLDDEVYSAPVIQAVISRRGIIHGRFTYDEVRDLVRILNAGSLPARVNPDPISVNSIGATLGETNIRRGLQAGYIGLMCVVAFMVVYYLIGGVVANVALGLNLLFVLGAMSLLDATFTLPGIAGLILMLGMAVDANVLIFERWREEQAKGQPIRQTLKNAYDKAMSAIVDSNITTIATCTILYWVGTPEVKGFALTLGLGILFSLFTSVLVSRWIFQALVQAGLLKKKLVMLKLVGVPTVDWMSKKKYFWTFSAIVAALGMTAFFSQGRDILGIEFRSGSRAVVRFVDDATFDGRLVNDTLISTRLQSAARELGVDSMTGQNLVINTLRTPNYVQNFIAAYDSDNDGIVSREEWLARGLDAKTFDLLGGDGGLTAEVLNRTLPEPRYQITTAETSPQLVRQVIDKAFPDHLDVQTRVDYAMFTEGQTIPGLGLQAGREGILALNESLASRASVEYQAQLLNFSDGALFAFKVNDAEQAMSAEEVRQRLRNTRLQAGRETVTVADTEILPLTVVPGTDQFTAFAVLVRSDDVPTGDAEAWSRFADEEMSVLTDALALERSLESLSNFDAAMTRSTSQRAIIAVLLSWTAIIGYLWLRFGNIRWGLGAVLCLIHDTIIIVGLVAVSSWVSHTALGRALLIDPFKLDMTMIAAILTVIGYSVNDTIVVFDRIRENRGRLTGITPSIVNTSINQTLSRTILTGVTTLVVVMIMYVWGGDGIHGFSFALLAGILFGTYSSIAVASPLLLVKRKIASAVAVHASK